MLYKKFDLQKIGSNIKKERLLQKLSLEKLAVMSGITRVTLVSIETGTGKPALITYGAVTNALRVSFKQMVD